jgi:hypothetical protein
MPRREINHDSHLLPSDEGWPDDNALLADLSHLNTELARYVLRQLDVDAGRVEPMSVDDEHGLGLQLIELGQRVQRRAALRKAQARGPVIEGEATQPLALEPSPAMDHGP